MYYHIVHSTLSTTCPDSLHVIMVKQGVPNSVPAVLRGEGGLAVHQFRIGTDAEKGSFKNPHGILGAGLFGCLPGRGISLQGEYWTGWSGVQMGWVWTQKGLPASMGRRDIRDTFKPATNAIYADKL